MKKISILFFLSVLFVASTSFALSGDSIYKTYKANEDKKEKKIDNIIMEFESSSQGMISKAVVYQKGKKSRVEATIVKSQNSMMGSPGQKTIVIDDGEYTTMFSPIFGSNKTKNDKEEYDDMKPSSVKYIGDEKVSGINCYKIDVSYGGYLDKETMWISKKDYILVKKAENNGDGLIELYSDFRKVKGYKMPFKTVSYEGDEEAETIIIKSVKTNAKIKDSLFDPEKVKGFKKASAPKERKDMSSSMDRMEEIMSIGMQIQKHYQNGEPEKAKALEKRLEKLTQGQ
eukprot:gnl/Chilomastix_cuspidata/10318.p1 GENE.gnl/Chilomastix_cuspidata/10318~~gnl/Chilomastix_cuspidata/10318.p1  ORF type:complete len:286 (+),score=35.01 gnl/Chilomastix_cuspidata/10318:186-1043(+)